MCMYQGRPCYSIWFYVLLIAVAIQGVTPDAQDLASIKTLRLLYPSLADSGNEPDNDGLPDEVCGPAQPDSAMLLRRRPEPNDLANALSLWTDHDHPLTIKLGAVRLDDCGGKLPRVHDLICSLCRFQC